jgi:hypothetical protein
MPDRNVLDERMTNTTTLALWLLEAAHRPQPRLAGSTSSSVTRYMALIVP